MFLVFFCFCWFAKCFSFSFRKVFAILSLCLGAQLLFSVVSSSSLHFFIDFFSRILNDSDSSSFSMDSEKYIYNKESGEDVYNSPLLCSLRLSSALMIVVCSIRHSTRPNESYTAMILTKFPKIEIYSRLILRHMETTCFCNPEKLKSGQSIFSVDMYCFILPL